MDQVFIGLGSNIGDGKAILAAAWRRIGEIAGVQTVSLSHPYASAPVGMDSPHWFTNAVGWLRDRGGPRQLLDTLMQIEAQFGRERKSDRQGYEDRSLDLDILFYGDHAMNEPDLIIPHPCISSRLFVLRPLAEIAPDFLSVASHKTAGEMEEALVEQMVQGTVPLQELQRLDW